MSRPILTRQISIEDFTNFYWLKNDLIIFCQENKLPSLGSKQDLTERIREFLETGQSLENHKTIRNRRAVKHDPMPHVFTRQSVIDPGWRCSQELRSFFEKEIGAAFHFDGIMRDIIHHESGQTLDQAIQTWEKAKMDPAEKEIGSQFEYNRHIRNYFHQNPGASLAEAIQAWKIWKDSGRNR